MAGYYDEILEEIKQLCAQGEEEEALYLISKELRMPYVPSDFEKTIKALQRDIKSQLNEKKTPGEESLYSILKSLRTGNEAVQIAAAEKLGQRNLRECLMEIQGYLSSGPCPEAAALIMEAIAEQEIREPFRLITADMEAEFYGDSLVPVTKSGGFRKAYTLLKKWLENDNPAILTMCLSVLSREVYMFLPLSYDASEGEDLALRVLEQVSALMDDGETYKDILASENI